MRERRWWRPRLVAAFAAALLLGGALTSAGAASDLPGDRLRVVLVPTATDGDIRRLLDTGLDVVDEDVPTSEVWLHGPEDAAALSRAGFRFTEVDVTADLRANARARAEEAALAEQLAEDASVASSLPTGRVSYRSISEIEQELVDLAADHPDRVTLFALPHPSLLGRTVYGVEISRDVHVESGKPVFLNTGIHHSREWPVAEFTMEFAYDVLAADGTDPRITRLLDEGKMIVVPVVNPDGYDISRRLVHEQKRKNCRVAPGQVPTSEQCAAATASTAGVDLNRNYGAFWGGPGSSATTTAENYRGEAPYSEPEIRNIVELTGAHQVTVAIHNHTPDGRLLRAPSSPEEPVPADVVEYDTLAQRLGAALGWPAGPWTQIYYEASGVAEQHAYYTGGIFGFTTEATPGHGGLARFHPPYPFVVDQYDGRGSYEGSSMREAFLLAWEAAVDPALHSVVTGTAPAGAQLVVSKTVTVDTSCAAHPLYALARSAVATLCRTSLGPLTPVTTSTVELASTLEVPADGAFTWHVLPSLRPSQYASEHIDEAWTITCATATAGGTTTQVTVARGQTAHIDLGACA